MSTAVDLIKIGELARRSGVPIATLKHYLREGLIQPVRKSGRTMAWYDPALATRVKAIKRLQRDQFLPLDLIKKTVDGAAAAPDELAAADAIASVLAEHGGHQSRTRAELIERGVPARELDWLANAGIAVPVDGAYTGDDLALLVTLGSARASGITPDMLPFAILGDYLAALRALVDVELRLFRTGVIGRAPAGQIGPITEAATRLSERLVILLRRKLLLPTLHRLIEETHVEAPARPARPVRLQQRHVKPGGRRRTARPSGRRP